jgi:hypothetical protein
MFGICACCVPRHTRVTVRANALHDRAWNSGVSVTLLSGHNCEVFGDAHSLWEHTYRSQSLMYCYDCIFHLEICTLDRWHEKEEYDEE